MKKAYWIDGRLLTERDPQDIRSQLEGFKRISAISDEIREVIETEWPDLAAKLLPPKQGERPRPFGASCGPGSQPSDGRPRIRRP